MHFLVAGAGVVSIKVLPERNNPFTQRYRGVDFTTFNVKTPFFVVTALQGIEGRNFAHAAIGNQLF
jgi:hypothetical protein